MGVFSVEIEIGSTNREDFQSLSAMVDTGAVFSRAPASLLQDIGVAPDDEGRFRTADNRVVTRPTGKVWIRLQGKEFTTRIIFGEEGETPLLGAIALEEAMLAVDPHNGVLVPVEGWLL
ncbi:MAG: hypothetical protein OXR67_08430 [Chloroflexota bacterium]|nr:hypothetical protein [Chloroflexota bacterium]